MKRNTISRGATMGTALLVVAPLLAACGGSDLSRGFGLTRDAPDEFTVTTRAPLSMPPDYALRPPQPGASRPQEVSISQSAQATVAGGSVLAAPVAGGDSPGQDALLSAAGQPAPGDIRAKVDSEFAASAGDHSLAETLLFWQTPPKPGVVVDPTQEAARLHENAALGKPPDAGDTPVIQRKTTSIFDKLF
jgi:hypothetical protein